MACRAARRLSVLCFGLVLSKREYDGSGVSDEGRLSLLTRRKFLDGLRSLLVAGSEVNADCSWWMSALLRSS